ncbi:MAG: cyclodeaminase/cyclohydrolase family protein [Lachnospiraceae bacterium]|nr:cyclodeaminase/cyclohydrolase family protein [Candidatus Fimimorpha excrementavium]
MYHKSVDQFMEALASKSSVPGGGGAAALGGSMAAALGSMVANLTIGKKAYAQVESQAAEMEKRLSALRLEFLDLINRDASAFEPVSRAYRLPKETQEERRHRREVMEAGLYEASIVPMEMMEKTLELLHLLEVMEKIGSRLAISDIGVAVQYARSTLLSASMNVFINTNMMEDRETAKRLEDQAEGMLEEGTEKADRIYASVRKTIRRDQKVRK